MPHLQDQHRTHALVSDSTLHVIGVISNPLRWQSRYRLFREWADRMRATPNVRLHVVETAFGDRSHQVTDDVAPVALIEDSAHPTEATSHLRLRTQTCVWQKESMINLAVRDLLPRDWRYAAWVDCDVAFSNPDWALQTIHQLQHFGVVQPWSEACDLGPDYSALKPQLFTSFGKAQQVGQRVGRPEPLWYYARGEHPGYAWACTRQFWEAVGGLIDFAILGSADRHMCYSIVGEAESTLHHDLSAGYKRRVHEWADRAYRAAHGQVGFTPGVISHHYHGRKVDRGYKDRWQILLEHHYDPDKHLDHDQQGLAVLRGQHALDHAVWQYHVTRNEDHYGA